LNTVKAQLILRKCPIKNKGDN